MDQPEQDILRLPVSEHKSWMIKRHQWSVHRDILLHLKQRQTHALQHRSVKSEGVTGVLLPILPLLALLPPLMASFRQLQPPMMASCSPLLPQLLASYLPRLTPLLASQLPLLAPAETPEA